MVKDVFKFCPGSIYGRRGWTPVIRILKNGRPVGSKTGPAMLSQEAADDRARTAALYVARTIAADWQHVADFVVAPRRDGAEPTPLQEHLKPAPIDIPWPFLSHRAYTEHSFG